MTWSLLAGLLAPLILVAASVGYAWLRRRRRARERDSAELWRGLFLLRRPALWPQVLARAGSDEPDGPPWSTAEGACLPGHTHQPDPEVLPDGWRLCRHCLVRLRYAPWFHNGWAPYSDDGRPLPMLPDPVRRTRE